LHLLTPLPALPTHDPLSKLIDASAPRIIQTARGIGYVFAQPVESF
jgi:hypothetical protein